MKKNRNDIVRSARFRFTLVFSDTDNDLNSVQYVLWLTGLCNKNGQWRKGVHGFCVVHTGDWLNKWNPNPEVLEFFLTLRHSAPDSCRVILLVGNHEVEILQRVASGVRTRLTCDHLALIREQDVLYVSGSVLYIHGYPTVNLLSLLVQIKKENAGLNVFNKRFRKAFHEGRYALFKKREGLEIIGDIRNVKQYYIRGGSDGETNGARVGHLLHCLGLDTVIHGHRPNVLIQVDYELQAEVPGIRMINNDNKAKMTGMGAVVVDMKNYVRFINPKAMRCLGGEASFRKRIRMILGTDKKAKLAEFCTKQPVHTTGKCTTSLPCEEKGTRDSHKTVVPTSTRVRP